MKIMNIQSKGKKMTGASESRPLRALIAAALLCSFAAVCGGADRVLTHSEYQLKKMAEKEDLARAAKIAEISRQFDEGRFQWQDGKYDDARKNIVQALNRLAALPGQAAWNRYADLMSEYHEMSAALGVSQLDGARQQYHAGNYNAALAEASAALKTYSNALPLAYVKRGNAQQLVVPGDLYASWKKDEQNFGKEADLLTRNCQAKLKNTEFVKETSLKDFDQNYAANKKEIEQLFRTANTYFQEQRYSAAIDTLEKIYLIDPFDINATSMLKKVYNKMYTAGVARRDADIRAMMAANTWRWVEPVNLENSGVDNIEAESKTPTSDIFAKLDRIILPSLEFEDSDINGVVGLLNQRSRTYDTMKEGVTFSIAMTDAERALLNKVNLRFSNIPLSEALRYICQDLGLKYRIDNNGVTIGTSVEYMQTQTFRVSAELMRRITDEAGGGGESSGGEGEGGEAGGGGQAETSSSSSSGGGEGGSEGTLGKKGEGKDYTSEDGLTGDTAVRKNQITPAKLRAAFTDWGISFDPGSSVSYNIRSNRLRVTNTVENLRRLDKLLRQMDAVKNPLVSVEVKLIEITETDMQELGFEWAFSMNNQEPGSSQSRNRWNATTNDPLRNSNDMLGFSDSANNIALVKDLKLLPNFGNGLINGVNMDLSLTINAVSQNKRTETLSAPRLVTSNGKEASLKMVRSYYFPEDWDAPEIETSGNFTKVTAPVPDWGDSGTDVGIMLKVRPQVDPNNSDITLELHPEVVSYIGQTDDTVKIARGYINYEDNTPTYTETWSQVYKVWMPILGRRKLDATIRVKDGETIVLGGMVDNKTESVYDRWPVLGDIPLIGRLFSSQYEKRENANLLIFVTTRLVNNNGLPFEQNVSPDIPDFRR